MSFLQRINFRKDLLRSTIAKEKLLQINYPKLLITHLNVRGKWVSWYTSTSYIHDPKMFFFRGPQRSPSPRPEMLVIPCEPVIIEAQRRGQWNVPADYDTRKEKKCNQMVFV